MQSVADYIDLNWQRCCMLAPRSERKKENIASGRTDIHRPCSPQTNAPRVEYAYGGLLYLYTASKTRGHKRQTSLLQCTRNFTFFSVSASPSPRNPVCVAFSQRVPNYASQLYSDYTKAVHNPHTYMSLAAWHLEHMSTNSLTRSHGFFCCRSG